MPAIAELNGHTHGREFAAAAVNLLWIHWTQCPAAAACFSVLQCFYFVVGQFARGVLEEEEQDGGKDVLHKLKSGWALAVRKGLKSLPLC